MPRGLYLGVKFKVKKRQTSSKKSFVEANGSGNEQDQDSLAKTVPPLKQTRSTQDSLRVWFVWTQSPTINNSTGRCFFKK